jgi:hypothetical protein
MGEMDSGYAAARAQIYNDPKLMQYNQILDNLAEGAYGITSSSVAPPKAKEFPGFEYKGPKK